MGDHGPRIDHIIIAAADAKAAADHIEREYGLSAYQGGRHQGWGTENWIVPLEGSYLEIAAVFDEPVAKQCGWGRLVLEKAASGKPWALVTFCVETPEGALATAQRLQADTAPMLRLRPDGSRLTWRVAAMSEFGPDRGPKPFFITWDDPAMRPDQISAQHQHQPKEISYIELSGDPDAMKEWLGSEHTDALPLRWVPGTPGIHAVGIATADGRTIVLKSP